MKKVIFIFSLIFVSFLSFANNGEIVNPLSNGIVIENLSIHKNEISNLLSEINLDKVNDVSYNFIATEDTIYDCEITIKGNFNGNEVDVVVTIYDVSWAGCQTLKLGVKAYLATH